MFAPRFELRGRVVRAALLVGWVSLAAASPLVAQKDPFGPGLAPGNRTEAETRIVEPPERQPEAGTVKAREAKILAALDEETEFPNVEMSLADFMLYLQDRHDIRIQFDQKALEAEAITTDQQVPARDLKGESLRSALDLLLTDLGLDWAITHEVLFITTPKQTTVKVYNVSDLISDGTSAEKLADVLRLALAKPPDNGPTTPLAPGPARGHFGGGIRLPQGAGPQIVAFRRVLIVRDNGRGHRELCRLLDELRAAAKDGGLDAPAQ